MKKFTFIFMGIILMSSVLITSIGLAWNCGVGSGWGEGGWCGCGPNNLSFSWVPNLTVEQSEKLANLQKTHIEEASVLRTERAIKNIELDQLFAQPQPKTEEILLKQKELSNLQSQLEQKCLSKQLEMRKILTEEQLSQAPYGFGTNENLSSGQMKGYVPPQGQGFGPGGGRHWGHRSGCRNRCW
jgi:Spy/CpxP family protein refolding chaperone